MDEDSRVRASAAEALGNIGPGAKNAVGSLLDALKDKNRIVAINSAVALVKIGQERKAAVAVLTEAVGDISEPDCRGGIDEARLELWCDAAWAVGQIGPDAKASVPNLVRTLRMSVPNSVTSEVAAESLSGIGQASVPELVTLLKEGEQSGRENAVKALAMIGKPAVPSLMEALIDEPRPNIYDKAHRHLHPSAADALVAIGEEAVPALVTALKDKDFEVRIRAADILGVIGPRASRAVPALVDAENTRDAPGSPREPSAEDVRKAAQNARVRIDQPSPLSSNASVPTGSAVVGSTGSNKYHKPTCEWARKINPRNFIRYSSRTDAEKARRVPCTVCNP